MSKKQTTGLIVAAVIFVIVGIISVITNALSSKMTSSKTGTTDINKMLEDLAGTSNVALMDMPTMEDFIAVVPINGTIQATADSGSMYATTATYNHDLLMEYVDLLIDNEYNKGIVLRLNTPGGTVYEADELYMKLMEYKETTGRPIWAYMESQCCSGGVYLAAAANEQYANRITTTGSIGVIMSTYDMSGLYEKLGIKEVNIVSAENKDMGSAGKPMTSEQKAIYQSFVDEYYNRFVEIVATGRNMSVDEVKVLADGRVYTATQAVDNGLIDGIKSSEEFDEYVKEQSGVDVFYEPASQEDPWAQLFGMMVQTKEKSESEVLVELMNQLESGVPMYYAEP
ncbi:MAG: signal peptide peptidase SppA [Lachnospiraceae bacterium]|nr:signal peptide peptidase SppA [Lachnospiraceae bacterium]